MLSNFNRIRSNVIGQPEIFFNLITHRSVLMAHNYDPLSRQHSDNSSTTTIGGTQLLLVVYSLSSCSIIF